MHSLSKRSGTLSLCAMIVATVLGCAGRRIVSDACVIERPGLDVVLEQMTEAARAEDPTLEPLLPATYYWLMRVDRDINLWGDPD